MPRGLLPAVALAFVAVHAAAEVRVQVRGPRVDITATAAPVSEVLDRLARQTGMKLVYEGPVPRQLVSVTLNDRSPADAIPALLEGLGLNFALVTDESGTRVQTLMLTGTAPAVSATASGSGRHTPEFAPRRPFGPQPPASPEAPDASADQNQEDVPDETALATPANAGDTASAGGADGGTSPAASPGLPGSATSPEAASQGPPNGVQSTVPPFVPPQFPVSPFAPQPPLTQPGPLGMPPGQPVRGNPNLVSPAPPQ